MDAVVVRLYDMEDPDFPTDTIGDLRTMQIFKCPVCRALTNKRTLGCNRVYGRTYCPHSSECWHHVLENMIDVANKPQPKSYKQEMLRDIEVFRTKYVDRITNDLVGSPDRDPGEFKDIETRSHRYGTFCVHDRSLGLHTLSIDEDLIQRAVDQADKVQRMGLYKPIETLLAEEPTGVKIVARSIFYGHEAHALLLPEESGVFHGDIPHEEFMRAHNLLEEFFEVQEHELRRCLYEGEQ